jgi:hypothetical protein
MHGEAASAPIQDLSSMRENLRQTLRDYDLKISLIAMKQVSSGK